MECEDVEDSVDAKLESSAHPATLSVFFVLPFRLKDEAVEWEDIERTLSMRSF